MPRRKIKRKHRVRAAVPLVDTRLAVVIYRGQPPIPAEDYPLDGPLTFEMMVEKFGLHNTTLPTELERLRQGLLKGGNFVIEQDKPHPDLTVYAVLKTGRAADDLKKAALHTMKAAGTA